MKRIINFLALLFLGWQANAQFYVAPGATLVTSFGGVSVITVADGDFIVDGTFTAVLNDFYFLNTTGNDMSISGSGFTSFDLLFVETGNQNLILEKSISARRVIFKSGHFDLNGNDIELNYAIEGENEARSFIGPNGGEIIHETILNAPVDENPANLGVSITTAANLSDVVIRRTHVPGMGGAGESINRQYTITPLNNSGLDATLRFHYLESELNGLTESELELWQNDGSGWNLEGSTDRDENANWIELSGIDSFSDWTAAGDGFTPVLDLDGSNSVFVGDVYPNPVLGGTGQVGIPVSTSVNIPIQLRVIDNLGRTVHLSKHTLVTGDHTLNVDAKEMGRGIYHLQIEAEGHFANLKLVVQ